MFWFCTIPGGNGNAACDVAARHSSDLFTSVHIQLHVTPVLQFALCSRAESQFSVRDADVLLVVFPQAEGEDNLKKMQLMELAILNGTYRDNNIKTRE